MKKVLFLLVSIMAFHGKIWAADAEDVQPKKVYKRPSNRPAPPSYAPPEPAVRGSVGGDSEVDKLFRDLDTLDADVKKMNEISDERKAVLDEARARAERMNALDNEVKGIKILESSAPRSARLSAVQEEALKREGSITSSEDAKRILNNEARKSVQWGSKDLDITSEEDQKRIKEKYDREKAALDEVTRSNNSTMKSDKAADSKVEYKSIKRQIQSYEANKRLGNYTPSQRAGIEAAHQSLKHDIKLYNQTAKKRRALEKEQRKLGESLERRQAALDDFNKLSENDKQEEKRLAASLGLDDPEQEAKAKVKSATKRLTETKAQLNNEVARAQEIEKRINTAQATLLKNKAPIKLEEKPVVKKKTTKKTSIFETVKSKVMPVKKVATAEKKDASVHSSRSSTSRSSLSRLSAQRSSKKTTTFAEQRLKNKSTKPSIVKRVFGRG